MKTLLLIWLALASVVWALPPIPQGSIKLHDVADTNISSHPREKDFNFGKSSHIRLKGHEMMMLAKFDVTPIGGWTVSRASLFLHSAAPHRLKTVGVSTVAVDWVEGDGRGSPATGGATFTWANFGKQRWGGRQSDFTDAALTAQGTRVHETDVIQRDEGWLEIEVPPDFVHALINGDSYGLAIVDEKGQTRANNDVHSREQSGFEPYLLVSGKPTGATPRTKRKLPSLPSSRSFPQPLSAVNLAKWSPAEPAVHDNKLCAWAYGDCEKANPVTGKLLEAGGEADYRQANSVWDGASSTVHLAAARNEFVGFHLCIEATSGQLNNVRVAASAPGVAISLFKDWYVKDGEWFPEVALPLETSFTIPDQRNGIEGQWNQSVLVELYVPHDAPAGNCNGTVRIEADGVKPFEIPIALTVYDFTLPDKLSFDVDLNAYAPPGDAEMELKFQRLAHAHRSTLNILGYNQAGRANADYMPPLEGSGQTTHVKDWTDFDRRHGRYFDGSAFNDLPRRGVPVTHAYLPFCESWPSDIRQHYRYTPSTTAYPESIVEHALKAPPIEEAFDQQYKEEFVTVLRQFAAHFRERGWTRTQFQFYLNNKYYFRDPKHGGRGSSWWLLDEPMDRDDWLALRFFGQLFQEAMSTLPGSTLHAPRFVFRGDISRPQWQRDWLDGIINIMCVSGELFRKNEHCMAMKRALGLTLWHYGTGNDIRVTNLTGEAWALKVFLAGGDGILPWNSLGPDSSFDRPTPTTLFYGGGRFGINGPLASLRLKAMRRGQQDVEYLALLASKRGWDREQVAAAVASLLKLDAATRESSADDAGKIMFERLSSEQFRQLRAAVATAIAQEK